MLSADDRHQVVEWSKRQLGNYAGLAFVMESDLVDTDDLVERSGTGLIAKGLHGCKPLLSIMANSAQYLSESQNPDTRFSDSPVELSGCARKPTWH